MFGLISSTVFTTAANSSMLSGKPKQLLQMKGHQIYNCIFIDEKVILSTIKKCGLESKLLNYPKFALDLSLLGKKA
jgi:hypothetical protein